jgi:hypothetical protein
MQGTDYTDCFKRLICVVSAICVKTAAHGILQIRELKLRYYYN